MIDIESGLFTAVATALRAAYEGIYVSGEFVNQPPRFPAVYFEEQDNSVLQRTQDSGSLENHAEVMYQVEVYSNLNKGKKAQAKAIMATVDEIMAAKGFTRTFKNPIRNMNDPTIYRMAARYMAVVGRDNEIYRR